MRYIDTVVVNGTEYGVIDRGGEYNVACKLGTTGCDGFILPEAPDDDVMFATAHEPDFAWMRTTSGDGTYEYALVALVNDTPEDLEYDLPSVE